MMCLFMFTCAYIQINIYNESLLIFKLIHAINRYILYRVLMKLKYFFTIYPKKLGESRRKAYNVSSYITNDRGFMKIECIGFTLNFTMTRCFFFLCIYTLPYIIFIGSKFIRQIFYKNHFVDYPSSFFHYKKKTVKKEYKLLSIGKE